MSVQWIRKASAGTMSVQHASVAPAAAACVSVTLDQSTSAKFVKELKVSVPIGLICDFEI